MTYKHASIVPLIGGETIAQENVFGTKPEYILSYSAFEANDRQLVEYYKNKVPYHHLDGDTPYSIPTVDVINTVCPCAGLSSLSPSASSTNANNDWMLSTARHVLGTLKPKVFWGENAPRLASKMGEPVVEQLKQIASQNGYTFSIYKTKSILHGLSQVRDRTFYFFWQGDKIPMLSYIERKHEKIEDTIRNVDLHEDDPMNIIVNKNIPSKNPFYKYVLEELNNGICHSKFQDIIIKSTNPLDEIEKSGIKYDQVGEWMKEKGFENEAGKCNRMYHKLKSGGNIMRKTTEIPKDYIGAFVGHMPGSLTHPDEDRYLTIRECLSIMKLPGDFILQGGIKNLNMICQNVPVTTAQDMAEQVQSFVHGRLDNQMIDAKFAIQCNKKQTINYDKVSNTLEEFIC
jgi:site-specific DNA-cytosine methylase